MNCWPNLSFIVAKREKRGCREQLSQFPSKDVFDCACSFVCVRIANSKEWQHIVIKDAKKT